MNCTQTHSFFNKVIFFIVAGFFLEEGFPRVSLVLLCFLISVICFYAILVRNSTGENHGDKIRKDKFINV